MRHQEDADVLHIIHGLTDDEHHDCVHGEVWKCVAHIWGTPTGFGGFSALTPGRRCRANRGLP